MPILNTMIKHINIHDHLAAFLPPEAASAAASRRYCLHAWLIELTQSFQTSSNSTLLLIKLGNKILHKNFFNFVNSGCGRAWWLPTPLTVQRIIMSGPKYASMAKHTASVSNFVLFKS